MPPRYLEKFTSADGSTTVYTFPLKRYEYQSEQGLRTAFGQAVGAHYVHDFLGTGAAVKEIASESVRFYAVEASATLLDAEIDELRSELFTIGLGKLWTLGADASRRWAWARLASMPEIMVAVGQSVHMPTSARFHRLSDWYDSSATTHTETVTSSPDTFNVTNPGNATVRNAVFRFRSNSSAGFTNPMLENLTTGESFSSTKDASSADDELKVDCGALTVEYSSNDGSSYADDIANFSRGASQVAFLTLVPGVNQLRASSDGTENFDLDISFYGAWH